MNEVPAFLSDLGPGEYLVAQCQGDLKGNGKGYDWLLIRVTDQAMRRTHAFHTGRTVESVIAYLDWVNHQVSDLSQRQRALGYGQRLRARGYTKVSHPREIHEVFSCADGYTTHEARDYNSRQAHSLHGPLRTEVYLELLFNGAKLDGDQNNFGILIEVVIFDM